MARKKLPGVKEDLNPNLIPMVDVMFLLLLFFMLGADMSQREQADLVLPEASEIQENKENKSDEPTTTVNIQHRQKSANFDCPVNTQGGYCRDPEHWLIVIRGQEIPKTSLKEKLQIEADASLEKDIDPAAGKRLSARKVIIRADKAAPYGDVNKIIETCSLVGIYKIEVGAALPPQ